MITPNKRNGKKQKLFTIGYEGIDMPQFLKCLKYHEVNVLVDVRELAFSRKKGFSKTALSEHLERSGIRYEHIRALGSPRDVRKQLKDDWDYETFFDAYREHLEEQQEAIDALMELLNEHVNVCLMCFEKAHEECHRSELADYVAEHYSGRLTVEPVQTWAK